MIWCEHCRDHYDRDHYTDDGMRHLSGAEYGPTGERMAYIAALEERVGLLERSVASELSDEALAAEVAQRSGSGSVEIKVPASASFEQMKNTLIEAGLAAEHAAFLANKAVDRLRDTGAPVDGLTVAFALGLAIEKLQDDLRRQP